jgi:thiol-disulfide isomerase/thioredoxin
MFRHMFEGGGMGGGGIRMNMGGMGGMGGMGMGGMPGMGGRRQRQRQQPSQPLFGASSGVRELSPQNWPIGTEAEAESVWLVLFYSPNCGHCRNFKDAYAAAAKQLKGLVRVAAVDCAGAGGSLCNDEDISGFPTVKLYPYRDHARPEVYEGKRSADALSSWASQRAPNFVSTVDASADALDAVLRARGPPKPTVVVVMPSDRTEPSLPLRVLAQRMHKHFRFAAVRAAPTPAFAALLDSLTLDDSLTAAHGSDWPAVAAAVKSPVMFVAAGPLRAQLRTKPGFAALEAALQQQQRALAKTRAYTAPALATHPLLPLTNAAAAALAARPPAGYSAMILTCPEAAIAHAARAAKAPAAAAVEARGALKAESLGVAVAAAAAEAGRRVWVGSWSSPLAQAIAENWGWVAQVAQVGSACGGSLRGAVRVVGVNAKRGRATLGGPLEAGEARGVQRELLTSLRASAEAPVGAKAGAKSVKELWGDARADKDEL